MKTIDVHTGRPYQVLIGKGLLDSAGSIARPLIKGNRLVVAGDSNVLPIYGERVKASLEAAGFDVSFWTFPAGEASKNPATLMALINHLAQLRLTRTDGLVALGGGVTGDLVGLAASLYLRGIRCLQIPTSLLAMVDSSVGGKTAVNLEAGKNLMGAFFQPVAVICDPACLTTLPAEEHGNGWAEIIKYAVLRGEPLVSLLEGEITEDVLTEIIAVCVGIKRDIVSEDEFEAGCRALLNLGHTIGHGIERASHYAVPHGRAVAIGMAVITRGAIRLGMCEPALLPRLTALIHKFDLSDVCPYDPSELMDAAHSDKKAAGDKITLILPQKMGQCVAQKSEYTLLAQLIDAGLPVNESEKH